MDSFAELRRDAARWITALESAFYPERLPGAIETYTPVLERFGELLHDAEEPDELLRMIQLESQTVRIQLLRVFRKYIAPHLNVEKLKIKGRTEETIQAFGSGFRDIASARAAWLTRPHPDEALIAVLDEHATRGAKGYELTGAFFTWFEAKLSPDGWTIEGPRRAGPDVDLQDVLPGYPTPLPVDFVIRDPLGEVRVLGFARYDSDRGGSQEDDRIKNYAGSLAEILRYADTTHNDLRVFFLNDGPGLLDGSMWAGYASLEETGAGRVIVATLKMVVEGGRLDPFITNL